MRGQRPFCRTAEPGADRDLGAAAGTPMMSPTETVAPFFLPLLLAIANNPDFV
jgi:hypothetical protein